MTYSVNYPNNQNYHHPNRYQNQYSGVTINVTNPTMNAYPNGVSSEPSQVCYCPTCHPYAHKSYAEVQQVQENQQVPQAVNNQYVQQVPVYQPHSQGQYQAQGVSQYQAPQNSYLQEDLLASDQFAGPMQSMSYDNIPQVQTSPQVQTVQAAQPVGTNAYVTRPQGYIEPQVVQPQPVQAQQAYPAQYYMNNYNILPGGVNTNGDNSGTISPAVSSYVQPSGVQGVAGQPASLNSQPVMPTDYVANANAQKETPSDGLRQVDIMSNAFNDSVDEPVDMSVSQNIISQLDARAQIEKEKEANKEKMEVVALTNEYIMSLENYLNNPNKDIRLMAAKEILTRLNEDRDRKDDAALNALLNKMMQDPDKLVRVAAMSAFSSGLATGNDFTLQMLQDMQKDPETSEDDALEAANILLKMSETKETKYVNVQQPLEVQE